VRSFDLDQRARNPTDQGERQLILDGQSSLAAFVCKPQDARNKPRRPLEPQWTGSSLFQEVSVQLAEQASSQNFGSLAVSTGLPHGEVFLIVLLPNYYMSQ
jgi:hypothetical protein